MISVLIVDDNEETRRGIRRTLQFDKNMIVVGEAMNGEDCIQKTNDARPDVVVMDIEMPVLDGIQACDVLCKKYNDVAVILSTMEPTIEKMQQCIAAGAKEILIKPYDSSELLVAIRRIYDRMPHPEEKQVKKLPAEIVAVYSSKGGSGVSLIATNLALAYTIRKAGKTLLLDYDVHYGSDALILHMPPKRTMAEWVQEEVKDEDVFREYLMTHKSGLDFLPAPFSPEQGDLVDAEEARNILKFANSLYDHVVIDVPSKMTEVAMVALEQSTKILLVLSTDILAVSNTRKAINILRELRFLGKVQLVLNRSNVGNIGVQIKEIEEALELKISYLVPSDGRLTVASINTGEPFVLKYPKSDISQAIMTMAQPPQDKASKRAKMFAPALQ
ncbi:MAG TPA: response regulator [Spirochaetia bacterium]|nr:response regulator [Spirochaetia bacterium]